MCASTTMPPRGLRNDGAKLRNDGAKLRDDGAGQAMTAPEGTTTAAALERLAPLRRHVASVLGDDQQAWLVGGVVRDALLARPLYDIDVVVDRDCHSAARSLARADGGSAFSLSDRWGCWRVVTPAAANDAPEPTQRHVDVCLWREGSIASDLTLRDLTTNAIAVPCSGTAAFVDPHGGVADTLAGRLRAVSDDTFSDDPLRLLRLVRLSQTLGMTPDPRTEQLAWAAASRAAEPSGERIFSELCGILESGHARSGMRMLEHIGVLAHVLPELAACRGIEQSRYHHLDVYEHTLAVLDNVEDIAANAGHYFGEHPHAPAEPFPPARRRLLLFAALFHDLGKPATHEVDAHTGRVCFVGHDTAAMPIVDAICDRWATSNSFRSRAKLLVRTHLALGMLLHRPLDARAQWRFLRLVEPCAAEAIVLSLADRLATGGIDDRRRWRRAHIAAARTLWRTHWSEQHDGVPPPLLDGNEIRDLTGATGAEIGRLVALLSEEQAAGTVCSRDEAEQLLRSARSGGPAGGQ